MKGQQEDALVILSFINFLKSPCDTDHIQKRGRQTLPYFEGQLRPIKSIRGQPKMLFVISPLINVLKSQAILINIKKRRRQILLYFEGQRRPIKAKKGQPEDSTLFLDPLFTFLRPEKAF